MSLIQEVKGWAKNWSNYQSKAGATGLLLVMKTVDHMFEHRDGEALAALIGSLPEKDSRIIRSIVGRVTAGVGIKANPKANYGLSMTMASNAGPTDLMPVLRDLVEAKVSFRGKEVQEQLLAKEPKPADFENYLKAVFRKVEKEHWSIVDLIAGIQGLAQEKVIEGKAA